MKLIPRHGIAGLSVCLLLAALVAPAAQATRPDDRATHGVGVVQTAAIPDAFERAVARGPEPSLPDVFERAAARGPIWSIPVAGPRPDDRATTRGPGSFATGSTSTLTTSGGFSWDDAFLGASAMLGICLLAAAGLLVASRRGRVAIR